jgi:hypothetical protein
MDSDAYLEILKRRVRQSQDWLGIVKRKFIFQQDKRQPTHCTQVYTLLYKAQDQVSLWSPNSPDLNLIKNV